MVASFTFDVGQLEPDGIHLNARAGRSFLEHVGREVHSVLNPSASVDVPPADEDVLDADVTLLQTIPSDSDDPVSEPEGDSDHLASILQVVSGNSRLLKSVQPLRDSFSALAQRTETLETQVRVRRQQDNHVFARIKEETNY